MKKQLYITPPGTYDLPFSWIFDASGFDDGTDHPNSSIYLQGGYGDFQLRRVVGPNRFLASDGTGKIQIQRASKGSYIQSDPVQAPNTPEIAIAPEEPYLETGKLWFDLFGISKPVDQPLTAQLAFQGVRRMKGEWKPQPSYKANPKSFTYEVIGNLTQLASANAPVVTKTLITDYDFELHQLILLKGTNATVQIGSVEPFGIFTLTAVQPGPAGDLISITIGGPPALNLPLVISVAGNAITVQLATDGAGVATTTPAQLVAALNANLAAAALVTASNDAGTVVQTGTFFLTGGDFAPITDPVCSIFLYDQNKVKTSNLPVLDIFYDGGPDSVYENGAIVPPLFYRKESILQIDFYSQITDPTELPTQVIVYLVGKKLYPCA